MQAEDFFESASVIELVEAAARGKTDDIASALARGADVNTIGREGMTPLFWALVRQNIKGFEALLAHGADPNLTTELDSGDGREPKAVSAIEVVLYAEDSRYLEALLKHGADANTQHNEALETPIFDAILHHRVDQIDLLLAYGADINHLDSGGGTPLLYAVRTTAFSIALHLLLKGADPSIQDKHGSGVVSTIEQYGMSYTLHRADEKAGPEFLEELRARGYEITPYAAQGAE